MDRLCLCAFMHVCVCTNVRVSWRIFCAVMIKQFCFCIRTKSDRLCVCLCEHDSRCLIRDFPSEKCGKGAYYSPYLSPHIWCIEMCFVFLINATWGSSDLKLTHSPDCIWENMSESRCTVKFVGSMSQPRALMDSLRATYLGLISPPPLLLFCYPSFSLCPLMCLDHCWGLCMLKWFSYVIRNHRGNKALTFPCFHLHLIRVLHMLRFLPEIKYLV